MLCISLIHFVVFTTVLSISFKERCKLDALKDMVDSDDVKQFFWQIHHGEWTDDEIHEVFTLTLRTARRKLALNN